MCTKTIFVDCFDTLIHRREHPHIIIKRWARTLNRLYPSVSIDRIVKDRFASEKKNRIDKCGVYFVYKEMANTFHREGLIENPEQFQMDARELEMWCEIASSFRNEKLCKYLEKQVNKDVEIYCITDYHLSSNDVQLILRENGISFLNGVFSSASEGCTKDEGLLFEKVIERLHVDKRKCMMIGDNKKSDFLNAKKLGLDAKYKPHFIHQNWLRIMNRLNILPDDSIKKIGREIHRSKDEYEEFIVTFFVFSARLYNEIKKRSGKRIVFLAREGFFLRRLFEIYQETCVPYSERIETGYLKLSRRAAGSLQEEKCSTESYDSISIRNFFKSVGFSNDEIVGIASQFGFSDIDTVIKDFPTSEQAKLINSESIMNLRAMRFYENKKAFSEIIRNYTNDKQLFLVDVGWTGSMQQCIAKLYPTLDISGYYIGIFMNLKQKPEIERHGLVFFHDEGTGFETKHYGILRSNTQLYEQLLAAPHGSALYYSFDSTGEPFCVEEWDEQEKALYFEVLASTQQNMLGIFKRMCTRVFFADENPEAVNRQLAYVMLRSALLQSEKRLEFMCRCSKGFVQNIGQESKTLQYNTRGIRIPLMKILIHPDRYVRFVSKLGFVAKKKGLGFWGRVSMKVFYFYTRLICRI